MPDGERIYREPEPPGPVGQALLRGAVAREDAARFKAQALMNSVQSLDFKYNNFRVDFPEAPFYQFVNFDVKLAERPVVDGFGRLKVVVESASVDGTPLKLDNPYFFVNPPVGVRDGTWAVVNGADVENIKEDPWLTLKTMLVSALWAVRGR